MSDKDSTPGTDSPPASGASPAKPNPEESAAAPGLPDLEAHAEAPQWLSGDIGHDTQVWSAAFEGGADGDSDSNGGHSNGGATAENRNDAEPALTNPDDVTLGEPSLDSPDISSEAAEAASLNDAAAEVKAVEAQAADAAVLTDPTANHPAAVSRTEGIAAAAPMTGNGAAADEPAGTNDGGTAAAGEDAGTDGPADHKTAPEPAGTGSSSAKAEPEPDDSAQQGWPAKQEEAAAPAEPADSRRSRRDTESAGTSSEPSGNGKNKRTLLIIGVLGVFAVLVVLFFTVVLGSEKEPGVLEEDVAPIELDAGACLADFTGVNEPVTVVTCETPHNAQLVATATYPDSDEFPGADALSERATEVCSQVRYSEELTESPDLELQENKVIPTPESWDDGDRRIDCFVVSTGEADLAASLLAD